MPTPKARLVRRRHRHQSVLYRLTLVVLIAGGLGLVGVGLNQAQRTHEIFEAWRQYRDVADARIAQMLALHRAFGYGGLIHNFKNYVMRKSPRYAERAEANFADLTHAAEELQSLGLGAEDRTALNAIVATAREYYDNIAVARRQFAAGQEPTEVDRWVKVDDTAAFAALRMLESHLGQSQRSFADALDSYEQDSRRQLIGVGLALIGFVGFLGYTATMFRSFYTQTAEQAAELIEEMERKAFVEQALRESEAQLGRYAEELEARVAGRTAELAEALTVAEKATAAKSAFLSVVSHELRTPLTSIQGSLKLLGPVLASCGGIDGAIQEKVGRLLDVALRNSEQLVLLVNDLLDLEKIQAGRMDFKMEPVDVAELVTRAVEDNQGYAQRLGVTIETAPIEKKEGCAVDGDELRLRQVLNNFLSNAAKYTPKGGTVTVSCAPTALGGPDTARTGVRISVADQGPGVPEEFRARIFQPFAQADTELTRKVGGTGLGLAVSKAIAERHDGRISFDSVAGEGATFHLELPLGTVKSA